MKYKHLANANVDVSCLAAGTWAIGGQNFGVVNRDQSIETIRTLIDNGVNLIDVAPVYGNGYAEQVVGEALEGGHRERVMISTKCGLAGTVLKPFNRDASFANIMRECLSSLRNLRTDYIDFYFIHWPDPETPISETMAALNLLKQMGKIKHIGLSNFSIEQIEEAMKYGQIDVIQPLYCMVDQKNVEIMRWAKEHGIDAFTYGSMGAGILTGNYREIPDFPANDTRMRFYDYYHEPKFSSIQKLLKTMDVIAEKHNVTVGQVALNYSASREFVGTLLVGASKPHHAIENCKAFDFELSNVDIDLLDKKLEELGLNK